MNPPISNYFHAFRKSQEALDSLQIGVFPVDVLYIAQSYGIIVATLTALIKRYQEHGRTVNMWDGGTGYSQRQGAYFVIFDDTVTPERARFTLAHELAHIILGHLNIRPTPEQYIEMEAEANTFASNFLAPPVIIDEIVSGQEIQSVVVERFFGLSRPAADIFRRADHAWWVQEHSVAPVEDRLLRRFNAHNRGRICPNCHLRHEEYHVFCKSCGRRLIPHPAPELVGTPIKPPPLATCLNEPMGLRDLFCPYCGAKKIMGRHPTTYQMRQGYKQIKSPPKNHKQLFRVMPIYHDEADLLSGTDGPSNPYTVEELEKMGNK